VQTLLSGAAALGEGAISAEEYDECAAGNFPQEQEQVSMSNLLCV
jgi:hypothetical protein